MHNPIIFLSTLAALIVLLGGILGGLYGVALALVLAFALSLAMCLKSDSMLLGMYKASPSDDYKLLGMLKNLVREAKIPVPKLYVIKTTHFMPNAFATGQDSAHSAIAVTSSLLSLKDDEIEAVLAHEIAHIRNRDALVNTLAATIGGAIEYPAQICYWHLFLEKGNSHMIFQIAGMIVMAIFAPIAAFFVMMAVSSSQEYRADYVAVLLTKRPRSLARALEKIHDAISQKPLRGSAATSHMWIANPFYEDRFTGLFSTHPPVRERIKRLLELDGRSLG